METLGYGGLEVILKSDQEYVIVAFKEALQEFRRGATRLEESAVGDSAGNGMAERYVRMIKDQVRTIKNHLECNIGEPLDHDNPVLQWLVRWVSISLGKFRVGDDNRTPMERLRGRR